MSPNFETQSITGTPEQFVYLYRDNSGNPIYVGRGRTTARSMAQTGPGAHNPDLSEALAKQRNYSIEIAGPFGSEEIAALVEGALISAFRKQLTNRAPGPSESTFRPLGVPLKFADRSIEVPLAKEELKRITGGRPALIVLLTDKAFLDGRVGMDLANPPTNDQIEARMVCWWQLNKRMDGWAESPNLAPSILIAASGRPGHRIVVGSLEIDTSEGCLPWESSPRGKGMSRVPVLKHENLDFGGIRGRRVDSEIAKFGGVTSKFFNII